MTMLTGNRMLLMCCCPALLTAITCTTHAADIEVGDTYEEVLEELGHPTTAFEHQDQLWLEFDRGKVNLENGKVVSVDLVSNAEARANKKKNEEEAAAELEEKAAKAKAMRKAGKSAKAKALSDKELSKKSATEQAKYWRDFRKKHPKTNVSKEITSARSKAKKEAAASLAEQKEVGIPPGLNRKKRRRYARSKSRQQAWSNKVVEARSKEDD